MSERIPSQDPNTMPIGAARVVASYGGMEKFINSGPSYIDPIDQRYSLGLGGLPMEVPAAPAHEEMDDAARKAVADAALRDLFGALQLAKEHRARQNNSHPDDIPPEQ